VRGFVDLQVNGFLGVDFTDAGLTVGQVRFVTDELARRGTIAYCLTITACPDNVYRENLGVIAAAMREPDLTGRVLGIHLEGPYLSPEPGARGAHIESLLRQPSVEEFERFQEWADGKIAILTLAPELPGAEELIRYASTQGVVVSIGHTNADDDSLTRAVEAGARLSTHLGNGIADQLHRHRNPIWWQLACDDLTACFITDGHHLPPAFIKSAIRAKGVERTIVVSDCAAIAGLPPGEYHRRGRDLVIDESGRISRAGTSYLAGSSATMADCMNHLASLGVLSEEELWQVGFMNPLRVLGIEPGDLAPTGGT